MTPTIHRPLPDDRGDAAPGSPGLDDAFLAVLAHELRNPLAPLRTSLDLLGRPQVAEETKQRARDIMARQLTKMAGLIDELAEAARIGNGKVTLQREPADAAELVKTALDSVRAALDEKQLLLDVELPHGATPIDVDRARFVQVVASLVSEAARRSERGRHIWLKVQASPSGIVVVVRDEGLGIPQERLPPKFRLFVDEAAPDGVGGQDESSLQAVASVTLMLASRLVALHGGELRVRSDAAGEGHEVALRLPTASAG